MRLSVSYIPLVEGGLDEFFLNPLLQSFGRNTGGITFDRNGNFYPYKKGGKNKQKVEKYLEDASRLIFDLSLRESEKKHLLIAGVDSDKDEHSSKIEFLLNRIIPQARNSTLIFVAIRDMETWAEYLLKPEAKQASLDRSSSKVKVYPNGKSSEANSKELVSKLRNQGCFEIDSLDLLCTQSPSYQHFHDQILAYLQKIS